MAQKFRSFRVDAIVLKHHDYGEADRLLTIFTRQKGKLTAIAKGVRKVRSKKGGHLEPFTHSNLLLATGRTWFVVTQAEAQDSYPNLTRELEILGFASYLVELVDRFTYEEEENVPIFNLLKNSLARLDEGEFPAQLVVRYFEIRLLDLLGFRPELKNCVVTGNPIQPESQYFSAALGGVVSPQAGKNLQGAVPISMPALKYLRHFQRSSFDQAIVAKPADEIYRELEILMQYYLTYILERGLNTPGFLRRIRRDAGTQAE
ncbi:MAG: DNA repair protein RecO [Anaerolineales bacterium]|nr:DNA repair protein RecO [Anaerolineales bacterium]